MKLALIVSIVSLLLVGDGPTMKQVFLKKRLKLLKEINWVSGKVVKVTEEFDGDYHIDLYTENSLIIGEIVCAHRTIWPLNCTCKGYENKIPIPVIGDSIKISGPFVLDKVHNIIEIHPIQELIFLK